MSNTNKTQEKSSKSNIYIFKNVWDLDKANFYDYISTMLDGWVNITTALDSVTKKINNAYFWEKVNEMVVYISSWDPLSKAMKKMPDIFPWADTSIIEAGENSGTMVDSLATLSEDYRNKYNLKAKVKASLTYPVIILLFLVLCVLIVMLYVIPAIKPLFMDAGVELPTSTATLIATSNFIWSNFIWLVFMVIALWLFFVWWKSTDQWKRSIDSFIINFPLVWKVYRNYMIAHIASTMGTLTWSWVPIIKTLKLTWEATGSLIYDDLFKKVIEWVSEWEKIVDSMDKADKDWYYFSLDFLQMLSVWEKTASIEKISKKINSQYSKEVDISLSNLTKWIEPVAILLAGLFVLWFAFAIFWAILKITEAVG